MPRRKEESSDLDSIVWDTVVMAVKKYQDVVPEYDEGGEEEPEINAGILLGSKHVAILAEVSAAFPKKPPDKFNAKTTVGEVSYAYCRANQTPDD